MEPKKGLNYVHNFLTRADINEKVGLVITIWVAIAANCKVLGTIV